MSKWGTTLIKNLIARNEMKETAKKRKKDDSWKKDPVEYEKRTKKAEEEFKTKPIITSFKHLIKPKPICPQCGDNNGECGFYE